MTFPLLAVTVSSNALGAVIVSLVRRGSPSRADGAVVGVLDAGTDPFRVPTLVCATVAGAARRCQR